MITGTLPVSFIIVDPEPSSAKHPLDNLLRIFHLISKALKNPPAMQETPVQFLGQEDPLEKGKATHSSILAWRIPCTIQSMGSQRVGHDWAIFTFKTVYKNNLRKIMKGKESAEHTWNTHNQSQGSGS